MGVGVVLSQHDDGDYPVAYFSRKLLPREEKYSTVEKKCFGVELGVQAFRTYLLGRRFVIETDHRTLEWVDQVKGNNPSVFMQPYKYTVKHRPGAQNGNADDLSRVGYCDK